MDNSRIEKAAQLHEAGMNCAQAVVCSYCDLFGVDERMVFRLAEGFGAGMGIQSVCGALTGLMMLIGLKNSSGSTENLTKTSTYKLTKEAAEKFKAKNGSIICAELKGIGGKPILRSCSGCIEDACKLAEEFLALEKRN